MHVCVCDIADAHGVQKRESDFSEAGVTVSCELHDMGIGSKFELSAREVCALNH